MTLSEAFAIHSSHVLYKGAEKTRRNYRSTLASVLGALGDLPIELISEEQVALWDRHMCDNALSGTTRRGYIIALRMVLNYFRKKGLKLVDLSDFDLPPNSTKERPYLEPDEIQKLIKAARNPRDKAINACTFLTGARISEILSIDRNDLDIPKDDNGYKQVSVEGKGGKWYPLFLNETAQRYLDDYLSTRTDRYRPLFISQQNRRLSVSSAEKMMYRCARDAGLEKHVTPHILRHSFATDLLNNGAPLYEVSKLLNHANIATTANIYGHFDTQRRKQALTKSQSSII